MSAPVTSFKKKIKHKIPYILGSKPSIQNAQLLVSTGVPSLDYVLGGGLPVGTVLLIEEDVFGTFSKLLTKYFMAEGILCGHEVIVASQDINTIKLITELPAPTEAKEADYRGRSEFGNEDRMKIAWRYQNMKPDDLFSESPVFGHNFDLSSFMDEGILKTANISHWPSERSSSIDDSQNLGYDSLLQHIRERVKSGQYATNADPEKRNILRIALANLGSPMWKCTETISDLCKFLYSLRALVRTTFSVCLLTVPWYLLKNVSGAIERCEHLVDFALRMDVWDEEPSPVLKEYNGLLRIRKLPALNTLSSHVPESLDLAFRLRRKKFLIQKLHLPPELQDTTEREQDDLGISAKKMPCGMALDF